MRISYLVLIFMVIGLIFGKNVDAEVSYNYFPYTSFFYSGWSGTHWTKFNYEMVQVDVKQTGPYQYSNGVNCLIENRDTTYSDGHHSYITRYQAIINGEFRKYYQVYKSINENVIFTYSPYLIMYKQGMSIGDKVSYNVQIKRNSLIVNVMFSLEYIGYETIDGPYGKYENCLKVKYKLIFEDGHIEEEYSWFALNKGPVKHLVSVSGKVQYYNYPCGYYRLPNLTPVCFDPSVINLLLLD